MFASLGGIAILLGYPHEAFPLSLLAMFCHVEVGKLGGSRGRFRCVLRHIYGLVCFWIQWLVGTRYSSGHLRNFCIASPLEHRHAPVSVAVVIWWVWRLYRIMVTSVKDDGGSGDYPRNLLPFQMKWDMPLVVLGSLYPSIYFASISEQSCWDSHVLSCSLSIS